MSACGINIELADRSPAQSVASAAPSSAADRSDPTTPTTSAATAAIEVGSEQASAAASAEPSIAATIETTQEFPPTEALTETEVISATGAEAEYKGDPATASQEGGANSQYPQASGTYRNLALA